jgi:hypothetical protein
LNGFRTCVNESTAIPEVVLKDKFKLAHKFTFKKLKLSKFHHRNVGIIERAVNE